MVRKNSIIAYKSNASGGIITVFLFTCSLFLGSIVHGQSNANMYGIASYYADYFDGRTTASGEVFSQDSMTAAHNTLPFGTIVKVTNLTNLKEVILKINDRGPFVAGRIIDLSKSAAEKLDFLSQGIVKVKVEVLGQGSLYKGKSVPSISKAQSLDVAVNSGHHIKDTNSVFTVQVGSFAVRANAENALARLLKIESLGFIKEASVNGKKVFRVQCGKNLNGLEAEQKKKNLMAAFPSAFILKFEE